MSTSFVCKSLIWLSQPSKLVSASYGLSWLHCLSFLTMNLFCTVLFTFHIINKGWHTPCEEVSIINCKPNILLKQKRRGGFPFLGTPPPGQSSAVPTGWSQYPSSQCFCCLLYWARSSYLLVAALPHPRHPLAGHIAQLISGKTINNKGESVVQCGGNVNSEKDRRFALGVKTRFN